MTPRLIVRPRWKVPDLDLTCPYVVVSITDRMHGEPARIPQRWGLRGILRFDFLDFDPRRESFLSNLYLGKPLEEWSMQIEDGCRLWDFLERQPPGMVVVVHCEAGASRSPSMAFAIADARHWPRSCIDWGGRATEGEPPNRHVYQVTLGTAPR